jgi:hypothetical protein
MASDPQVLVQSSLRLTAERVPNVMVEARKQMSYTTKP